MCYIRINILFSAVAVPFILLLALEEGRKGGIARGVLYFLFYILLMVIAETDYYTYRIPDKLNLIMGILGLVFILVSEDICIPWRLYSSLIVPSLLLLLAILRPGAIGGGDIKLLASAGIFIGFEKIMFAAAIGSILAGMTTIGLMAKGKANKKSKMAMAPYYMAGIILCMILN